MILRRGSRTKFISTPKCETFDLLNERVQLSRVNCRSKRDVFRFLHDDRFAVTGPSTVEIIRSTSIIVYTLCLFVCYQIDNCLAFCMFAARLVALAVLL